MGSDLDLWNSVLPGTMISIHAPRVGSDLSISTAFFPGMVYFNPRSPCGERQGGDIFSTTLCKFQSPLPVWGATATTLVNAPCGVSISIPAPRVGSDIKPQFPQTIGFFISIPAPRVGSDSTPAEICRGFPISIPAPRVGSDFHFHGFLSGDGLFQSPLPVWGATSVRRGLVLERQISIPAPRVGSDR